MTTNPLLAMRGVDQRMIDELVGHQTPEQQKRYRHRDGHMLWGVTNVSLVRDAHGHPAVYVGQVQDVTARKAAEDELRASEARLRLLIDSVRDYAIFMTDPDGTVVTTENGEVLADPPELLRKNVTSPGGTTAAALDVLMGAEGMQRLLSRAVAAAAARSRDLAK